MSWSTKRRDGVAGSVFFGGQVDPAKWNILFKPNDLETRDALLAVLSGDITEERRLLAVRDDVAQTRVLAYAAPLKITEHNELDISVDFEGSDSVWRSESPDTATKSFSSTLDQAMHLDVPGNTRTAPRIILTPTLQRSTSTVTAGWQYRRRYFLTNNADEPLYRYPLRISLGSTTALVSGSKAQADADDVRVIIDGIEVERTVITFNTAASYVWFIVEALPAGDTMTIEVWYGNANATNPPVLAYPNLPAITLSTSDNGSWLYPIDDVSGNKGLGAWGLLSTVEGAVADFTIPAAWRRARTLELPDNTDDRLQSSYRVYTATGTWVLAGLYGWRAAKDYLTNAYVGVRLNAYDGVAISHPLGIISVTSTTIVTNINAVGSLVILVRDSSSEDWVVLAQDSNAHATPTTLGPSTYTPLATMHHLAYAVWPNNWSYIPDTAVGYIAAYWDTLLTLTIDSSKLSITGGTEEAIYEIATELRIGGGQDRIAPYRSVLIGNARSEAGAGVPRCGILLTQALVIDCDERTHEVWDSALVAKIEDVSAHAVQPVVGYDSDGTTTEGPSNLLLAMAPPRTTVPNGDFEADLSNWVAGTTTAGVTATRTWDNTQGGVLAGSLKVAITPNSAGAGASAETVCTRFFAVNGRDSVDVAAWVRTSTVNITPRLRIAWYDENQTLLSSSTETDWTPVANTAYRRVFAALVPAGAVFYRVVALTYIDGAAATGNAWYDDVSTCDAELIVADVAMGTIAVTAEMTGNWLG